MVGCTLSPSFFFLLPSSRILSFPSLSHCSLPFSIFHFYSHISLLSLSLTTIAHDSSATTHRCSLLSLPFPRFYSCFATVLLLFVADSRLCLFPCCGSTSLPPPQFASLSRPITTCLKGTAMRGKKKKKN